MTLKCKNCGSEHELVNRVDLGGKDLEEHDCLVCGTQIYSQKVAATWSLRLLRDATKDTPAT